MCGIVGMALAAPAADIDVRFDRALASINHRGPDANGRYRHGNVLLGHARLAIIDLSDAGRQPMATTDQQYVISYNGEVYNFRELMREHAIEGLRSHADTEVVLRLFAKLGPKSLALLNGMFAFALHDVREQKLWLVRDRLGIKPLYYRLDEQGLRFSSEIKAILALGDDAPVCDPRCCTSGSTTATRSADTRCTRASSNCCRGPASSSICAPSVTRCTFTGRSKKS